MLAGPVILFMLAALFIIFSKPVYNSSWTLLLPGTSRVSTLNLESIGEAVTTSNSAYGNVSISPKSTYKEIALSDSVIIEAANSMDITSAEFGRPKIKLIDQTPAMLFSVKASNSEQAQQKAVAFNQAFQLRLDKLRKDEISHQQTALNSQLKAARTSLTKARNKMSEYQTVSRVISDEQFQELATNTEKVRLQHAQEDSELQRLSGYVNELQNALQINIDQAHEISLLQSDKAINSMLSKLGELRAETAANKSKLAAKHIKMILLEKETSALEQNLFSTIQDTSNTLAQLKKQKLLSLLREESRSVLEDLILSYAKMKGQKQQVVSLAQKLNEFEHRLSEHSNDAAKLSDLKRNHQIAEAIFSSALAKIDTGGLDVFATYPLTQMLTEPGDSVKKSTLKIKLMIAASIIASLLYMLGVLALGLRKHYLKLDE